MAVEKRMKLFYGGLGVIAVAGVLAIWVASRGSGAPPVQILDEPFALGTEAFPGYVIGSDSAPVEIHDPKWSHYHEPAGGTGIGPSALSRLRIVSSLPAAAECCGVRWRAGEILADARKPHVQPERLVQRSGMADIPAYDSNVPPVR